MKGTILGFHSIVEGDVRSGLSAKELSMPTAVLLKFSIFGGTHVNLASHNVRHLHLIKKKIQDGN
jgi:hypothetical protein